MTAKAKKIISNYLSSVDINSMPKKDRCFLIRAVFECVLSMEPFLDDLYFVYQLLDQYILIPKFLIKPNLLINPLKS